MSDKSDTLSRRKALLRLSGLALGAYATPSLTTLSMARASSHASGASGPSGGRGDNSGPSGESGPSDESGPSGESGPSPMSEPSEVSRASIPSGIDNAQDCHAAGGEWNPGDDGSCS